MPRHLINDAHEWINEIPTDPIYYLAMPLQRNGLIHCRCRDGGLGIPRLETMTTSSSLKTGLRFLDGADPVMRAIARESNLEQKVQGMHGQPE
jgi:hypothetical protein